MHTLIVCFQYTCTYAPLNSPVRRRSMVNSRAGAQQLFQPSASPTKSQPNPTLASARHLDSWHRLRDSYFYASRAALHVAVAVELLSCR